MKIRFRVVILHTNIRAHDYIRRRLGGINGDLSALYSIVKIEQNISV